MLQQLNIFVKKKNNNKNKTKKPKKNNNTNLNVYWATIIAELRKSNMACDWVFFW